MSDKDYELEAPKPKALDYSKDGGGFFIIRRRGQGKWTRIGTAVGSGIVLVGMSMFIYSDVRANLGLTEKTALISAGIFLVASCLLAFWIQNKPGNVTFLIDTDSEMKKVNWTSRQELIGSTKIVIGFMLILATFLFVVDLLFGYFFWGVGVLKFSPGLIESLFHIGK